MTIIDKFNLVIPEADKEVAYQRYRNLVKHVNNGPDGFHRIILDKKQYGLFKHVDEIQMSCLDLATSNCVIWAWDIPRSWYFHVHDNFSYATFTNAQFIEEFYEFIDDYTEE